MRVFLTGNVFEGRPDLTSDNHLAIDFTRYAKGGYLPTSWEKIESATEFPVDGALPKTDSAEEALERVLTDAGASHRRDAADARLVSGVRDRTHRRIDSQRQVGGWPQLASEPTPKDTDQDGMPDEWEQAQGLDPADAEDHNGDRDADGFTNLEAYLNSRAKP